VQVLDSALGLQTTLARCSDSVGIFAPPGSEEANHCDAAKKDDSQAGAAAIDRKHKISIDFQALTTF